MVWWVFLVFYIKIRVSVNRDNFTSSFLIWMSFLFIARIFNANLNKSKDSGHSCLALAVRQKAFSFSPLSITLNVNLSYPTFTMLKYIYLYIHFVEVSYTWILNTVKCFSESTAIIIWLLSFILWKWCVTLINLWMLKHPFIPGINPTWLCVWLF